MKYIKLLNIILLILSVLGLYLLYSEETNKYFKSMGYLIVSFSVFGITFLKRKQLKENGENI
jgi:hypothetical protein